MMSGAVRPSQVRAGSALHRRRLEELFLWAVGRTQEVPCSAFQDNQLRRVDFSLSAWLETNADLKSNLKHKISAHGSMIPDSQYEVVHDDGYFEASYGWSLRLSADAATEKWVAVWPTINGQSAWGGLDYATVDQQWRYLWTAGTVAVNPSTLANRVVAGVWANTYDFTLGGQVTVKGGNGRSQLALMTNSLGSFKVEACAWNLLRVLR